MRCCVKRTIFLRYQLKNSELYHIDINGNPEKVDRYKAIGSGADTADKFCAGNYTNERMEKLKDGFEAILKE
jgi:20S proteasome alpha/beta subunit